jgi:hypothetical protein
MQMVYKTANINVQKVNSLSLVVRMTIMTPVKLQISQFHAEKSCQVSGSIHERLLCDSSRSYTIVFRIYAISFQSKSPEDLLA